MATAKRRNLFYILLVPVGVAFVVTAFGYWIMAFQALRTPRTEAVDWASHPLIGWLRANGASAMAWELGALAGLTLSAIGWDAMRHPTLEE